MSYGGGGAPSQTEQMTQFLVISSTLTGFSKTILAPGLDPFNLKQTYFEKVSNDSRWPSLLMAVMDRGFASQTRTQQEDLLSDWIGAGPGVLTDSGIPALLKLITKLWYLGTWYAVTPPLVLTAQSYIHGLAWKVMRSHAMAASTDAFGAWGSDPSYDLTDATGGVVSGQEQGGQS